MVKIDGSFIQNLGTDAEDEMFVRTLIDLARSFGVVTVGEWVGDERTVKLLEKAGVSYMQGYFFGRPELPRKPPRRSRPSRPASSLRGKTRGKPREHGVMHAFLLQMPHRVQHIFGVGRRFRLCGSARCGAAPRG